MLIDCDAHISTPNCFAQAADSEFNKRYIEHYQKTKHLRTPEQQREEAESLGVTHQLINFFGMGTGLNYHLQRDNAVNLMQVYNDSMSTLVKKSNGFFSATGWLAMQDVDASLRELDKIKTLGLFGVFIDDTIPWGRAEWARPIFKKCNDLKIPVYLHFTKWDHHIDNQLSAIDDSTLREKVVSGKWPSQCKTGEIDTFLRMFYSLFESGWLNEFKNLKIIIAERGVDWVRPFSDHISSTLNVDSITLIKKHFWFTTEPEDHGFKNDVDYIGWDRVLFASDHGHDADCGGANFGKDLETIKNLNLSPEQYDCITFKNFINL